MWAHAETLWKRYVASPKSQELILRLTILSLIYLWAFSIRLVSSCRKNMLVKLLCHSRGLQAPAAACPVVAVIMYADRGVAAVASCQWRLMSCWGYNWTRLYAGRFVSVVQYSTLWGLPGCAACSCQHEGLVPEQNGSSIALVKPGTSPMSVSSCSYARWRNPSRAAANTALDGTAVPS
jgi:hypothetical protein